MLPIQYQYPEDRNGTNPDNRIVDERHTITPANGADFNFLIPRAAPYFENSMVVTHVASGTTLIKGIDWVPSYKFEAGSLTAPFLQLYGAISILTTAYDGATISLEYQTLGGAYVLSESDITTVLANATIDPRLTSWESVTLVPGVYLPEPHLHNIVDTVGYDELVIAVREIAAAILGSTEQGGTLEQYIQTHVNNLNNPHQVALEDLGIERFENVFKATTALADLGTNDLHYMTVAVTKYLIQQMLTQSNSVFTGQEGFLPFFDSEIAMDLTADELVTQIGIVHNAAELTEQLAYRESFGEVFNNWRRIAYVAGNPLANPAELTGWEYNSATDRVISTINSSSRIGLISPTKTFGDYVFEVELSSTNNDDDLIGITLGIHTTPTGTVLLSAFRSATVSGASFRLEVVDESGIQILWQNPVDVEFPNGWNGYGAVGPVLFKAERVGNILTVSTSDPGQPYGYSQSFDLSSNPKTQHFVGGVNLGYIAQSQAAATWNTLQRTGANPKIAALHTSSVYAWTGSSYTLSGESLSDVLKKGRLYRNPLFKRLYYGSSAGSVLKLAGSSVSNDASSPKAILGTNVAVDITSHAAVGNYVDFWSQNPSTGAMTYRGYIARYEATSLDVRSAGLAADSRIWLGDENKRHAGITAQQNGVVGFSNVAGTLQAYVGADGRWNHGGLAEISDERVKTIVREFDFSNVSLSDLTLFEFIWKEDVRIPDSKWGTVDVGPMAQHVANLFPHCASLNIDTGLITIDKASLALTLTVGLAKKLKALGFDV